MQNIICIKNGKLPLNFLIAGYILAIAGIVLTFTYSWFLIVLFIVGIIIISLEDETYIDAKNEKIKKITKVLWYFKIGDWEKLTKPQYIALVPVKQTQQTWVLSISLTQTDTVCKLNFIYPNNKYKSLKTGKKPEMLELAKQLSAGFEIKIWDSTGKDKVWIV